MPSPVRPSLAQRRALALFGQDLRNARLRRRLTMAVLAERAFTSRQTLQKVEAGDPAVAMGIYASVLQALGLLDRLAEVAGSAQDAVGLALSEEALPQRVRAPSKAKAHG